MTNVDLIVRKIVQESVEYGKFHLSSGAWIFTEARGSRRKHMDFDEIKRKLSKRFTFPVCVAERNGRSYIASAQEDYTSIMAFATPSSSELPAFSGVIEEQKTLDNGLTLFTPSFDTSVDALAWFLYAFGGMKWTPVESRKIARLLLVTGTIKICSAEKIRKVLASNKS